MIPASAAKYMVVLSTAVVLALAATAPGGAAKPNWRCIATICLGHTRAGLDRKYGARAPDLPSRMIRVRGGTVQACFWTCTDAVTEDGFTFYGGTLRPADRVITVSTCDAIVELPDGTTLGVAIPSGKRWRGYRRIWMEGGVFGWEKIVREGTRRTRVVLTMSLSGRVRCVDLERLD